MLTPQEGAGARGTLRDCLAGPLRPYLSLTRRALAACVREAGTGTLSLLPPTPG